MLLGDCDAPDMELCLGCREVLVTEETYELLQCVPLQPRAPVGCGDKQHHGPSILLRLGDAVLFVEAEARQSAYLIQEFLRQRCAQCVLHDLLGGVAGAGHLLLLLLLLLLDAWGGGVLHLPELLAHCDPALRTGPLHEGDLLRSLDNHGTAVGLEGLTLQELAENHRPCLIACRTSFVQHHHLGPALQRGRNRSQVVAATRAGDRRAGLGGEVRPEVRYGKVLVPL
mmetsp:Transcript_53377/g.165778  ORF Transcript_53377/g.165778 Transcript_53377/m.165778 type:complete len:227 (-) Transcript_53377:209-889(-)